MEEGRRRVRHGHYGFLLTSASEAPAGFSVVVLPALPVPSLMFNTILIEPSHGSTEHLVVSSYYPQLGEAVCEQVRQVVASRWPAALTSFITQYVYDEEGPTCRCAVYGGQGAHAPDVAAAAAEVVRWGTLDDIHAVSVTVDGQPYAVTLTWAGTHADATIIEGAG